MTPAEHAALSAQLARALGWPYIGTDEHCVFVTDGDGSCGWFDYRDPSVALPALEWLMREHEAKADADNLWFWVCCGSNVAYGDTLPEAIARAAIAVTEGK